MVKLTLYSRPECHLCEALLADLLPLLGADVGVETVDVDSSVALERRYGCVSRCSRPARSSYRVIRSIGSACGRISTRYSGSEPRGGDTAIIRAAARGGFVEHHGTDPQFLHHRAR